MNKDLYLVRHGQTIFNLKRIIQGWSDSPLTQLGCEQAARAGMFLRARGVEPDHAYTSTLHRTEQTIASLWPGLAYERLDGLREWFFGDFEAERVMLMPERPWRDFYRQFGGEGQMQVRERMVTTLTDLMRRPDHSCVLAVSHASAIKEFLDHSRGA
ncbi:MAG: histidine phosphatase family protein, partial [Collinsella sp.]|nr:histidine phosphatase family protein [Collinsella sp.]